MHHETKIAFREALTGTLTILHQNLGCASREPFLVWTRAPHGNGWSGTYEDRPSLVDLYSSVGNQIDEACADFARIFLCAHPQYGGLVGLDGFGSGNLAHSRAFLVTCAAHQLWVRHSTFECDDTAIRAMVAEFEEFVDSQTVLLRFQSTLHNFSMTSASITLPINLIIRPLSNAEYSDLHGGPYYAMHREIRLGIDEFVIEGQAEVQKKFNSSSSDSQGCLGEIRANLDRAILALRTFKEGYVGYGEVRFKAMKYCPLMIGSYGMNYAFTPTGTYSVSVEEIPALTDHSGLVFGLSEPALERACARLGFAETRVHAADRLVDAVIGMEAILLAAQEKSELSYRFSINYSTLFESPEKRYEAYRIAKGLYGARSKVAHGSDVEAQLLIGDEKMSVDAAARLATQVLRDLIRRFLPIAKEAPYKKQSYWERGYFGLKYTPK